MDYEARVRSQDFGKRHLPADIARSLRLGRRHRGWSLRTAERNLGVSFSYLCHLENGNRVPSSVVAELLIDGYRLGAEEARRLRSSAVPDAGRSSRWKTEQ